MAGITAFLNRLNVGDKENCFPSEEQGKGLADRSLQPTYEELKLLVLL